MRGQTFLLFGLEQPPVSTYVIPGPAAISERTQLSVLTKRQSASFVLSDLPVPSAPWGISAPWSTR